MAELRIGLDAITCHFADLDDPRSSVNRLHPFVSVVVLALMGVLAGATGPTSIARGPRSKSHSWRGCSTCPTASPATMCFVACYRLSNRRRFKPASLRGWTRCGPRQPRKETAIEQPIFAVDGKTLRRSHDKKNGLGALHSVSLWASEFGLSLGQVACAEKSNEIAAIPEVLKLVNIRGVIVTIDAMGTQKAIAAQIVEQEAD